MRPRRPPQHEQKRPPVVDRCLLDAIISGQAQYAVRFRTVICAQIGSFVPSSQQDIQMLGQRRHLVRRRRRASLANYLVLGRPDSSSVKRYRRRLCYKTWAGLQVLDTRMPLSE